MSVQELEVKLRRESKRENVDCCDIARVTSLIDEFRTEA